MTAQAPIPAARDWTPFVPLHDAEDDAGDWRDELGATEGDVLRALYCTWTERDSYAVPSGHGHYRYVEHDCTLHKLIGVTAENADERLFLDRETVMERVGEAAVNEAENLMDERANW